MSGYEVLAGTVVAAHGVQGAVKIRLSTETSRALIGADSGAGRKPVEVWLGAEPSANGIPTDSGRVATITNAKEMQPGGSIMLVKILGVRDRDAALALVGRRIFAPESRRSPLKDDEYFTDDLIGIEVVGDTGRDYGRIKAVLPQPANDVYETDTGALIPAVKDFVLGVDIAGRRVTVRDVPGLRPEEAEEIPPGDERPELSEPEAAAAAGLEAR